MRKSSLFLLWFPSARMMEFITCPNIYEMPSVI